MIVLTGGAGFIGSCILAKLNERGISQIYVVDHVEHSSLKKQNLIGKDYEEYFDKKDFRSHLTANRLKKIEAVIHMGACSSTTLNDPQYFEENNYQYTRDLAMWAIKHEARFIYASSAATYGGGELGYSDEDSLVPRLKPMNLYGQSKQKFDMWVLNHNVVDRMVGLKFFNVFGPNEYHKGDMRSVMAKAYPRIVKEGKIALFKSYKPEYGHGEQKRDFIYVKDAVDVVMYFFDHPQINGIYNVGTGKARSWNDVAKSLFAAAGKPPVIEYVEMPENLRGQYQYFTQAEMAKLRRAGYQRPFTELEDAVKDYAGYLKNSSHL